MGRENVLTKDSDTASFTTDWRGRFKGRCAATVRPGSAKEVSEILRYASTHRIPVVPQGGNTGLVGGGIPDATGTAIVITLTRMNRVRKVDVVNDTMIVEAGCILANIQAVATELDRIFPLSLGSEGSCQIGGNIATNAGGLEVVRYGPMRDHVLGLEVVLPNGDILEDLLELRKNNTGYDLKQLFIGAEGTLGIITAAAVRLYPRPHVTATAFCALASADDALSVLSMVKQRCGSRLSTFEILSKLQVDLVCTHADLQSPLAGSAPWFLLIELTDPDKDAPVDELLLNVLSDAMESGIVADAAIAQSDSQKESFWAIRHRVSEANVATGRVLSHDTSVPVSLCVEFIRQVENALNDQPGMQLSFVGHLGDGNIHAVAIFDRDQVSAEEFEIRASPVSSVVYDIARRLHGSISAEHGVGVSLRDKLPVHKNPVALELMRKIKRLVDPDNIMNPAKLVSLN
ncbi:FAD-binding oxidoreductase [Paraburkholderia terricola]